MSTRKPPSNCLVCLHPQNDSSSKSSKNDHLDKLKQTLSTFGQLIGLPLYINDSGFDKIVLQSINFCVRCSNTFQRIYYELEELKSLEFRLKKSKDEIQKRILGVSNNENEDLNPFTVEYRNIILKGIKSNLAKDTTDCNTKSIMPPTTRIKKEKIDEYEESTTSTSNGGVWNMLKKEIRVSLKPLQINPQDFGKTFILLDQLKLNQNNNFGTATCNEWTEEDINLYSKATSTDDLEIVIECEETRNKLRRKKSEINYDEDTLVAQNVINEQESTTTTTTKIEEENSATAETETDSDTETEAKEQPKPKPKPKRMPKQDGRKARPHVCKECNRGFRHLWHLEVHENTHTGATPFQCEHCDESFASGTLRSQHSLAAHFNYNKYPCDICKKYFPSNSELLKHSREDHKISPFKCSICHMELASKRWLTTHISRVHRPGRITTWKGPKSTTVYTGPKRRVGRPKVYDENNPKPQTLVPKRPVGRPRVNEPKIRVKFGRGRPAKKPTSIDEDEDETDYDNKEPDHVCGICFEAFYHFYDLDKHLVTHTKLSTYDGANGTNENDVYIDNNEDDMDVDEGEGESENIYQEGQDDEELPDFLRMDYPNDDEDINDNLPVIYSVASLCEPSADKVQQQAKIENRNQENEKASLKNGSESNTLNDMGIMVSENHTEEGLSRNFTQKNVSNSLNEKEFIKSNNHATRKLNEESDDSFHSESNTASDNSAETNIMDKETLTIAGRNKKLKSNASTTISSSAENNCDNDSINTENCKALNDIGKIISKHMANINVTPNIESETEFPLITVKSLETLKVQLPIEHNRRLQISAQTENSKFSTSNSPRKNNLPANSSNFVSANTNDREKEKLIKAIPKENSNFAQKKRLDSDLMDNSDSGERVKCKVCGIHIKRRCYKNHLYRIHYKRTNRIQCQVCLKTMKAETLKKHARLHHPNHHVNTVTKEKRVKINILATTNHANVTKIGQRSPKKKEIGSNKDDRDEVQCSVCLKYISRDNMKNHMKITHRAKGYKNKQGYKQCSVCSRIIGKSNFARHFRLHNANIPKRKFTRGGVKINNNNVKRRNANTTTTDTDSSIIRKSPSKIKTNSPSSSSSFSWGSSGSPSKGQKSFVENEEVGVGQAIEVETKNSLNKLLEKFVKLSKPEGVVKRGARAHSASSSSPSPKKKSGKSPNGKNVLYKYKTNSKLSKCEICEKSILSCSLGRHIRLVHIGIKDYTCTEPGCKKSFSTKQIMERHAKALHKK